MVPPQDAGRPAAASGGPAVTGPIRRLPPHGAEEPPWPGLAALTVAFGVVMIPLAFTSVSLHFQTGRDLVGGFISVAVALVALAVLAALAAITPGSSSTASG